MASNPMKMATDIWGIMLKNPGFASSFKKLVITTATAKNISAEFTVTDEMANQGGHLHGGATATIADVISTVGLMLGPKSTPGVSVNLNMSYLKGAAVGEVVVVDSETLRVGKTLAYLDIKVKKKNTGELIATGSHVKHLGS